MGEKGVGKGKKKEKALFYLMNILNQKKSVPPAHFIAVSCSVSQCVAVFHSVLQCFTLCCSVSQCVAVFHSVLQCFTVCCGVLQCVAVRCSALSSLQCVAAPKSQCIVY